MDRIISRQNKLVSRLRVSLHSQTSRPSQNKIFERKRPLVGLFRSLICAVLSMTIALFRLSPSLAQGIPTFDASAIANQVQQLESMAKQLESLKSQLEQGEKLFGSLNKLTDMSSIAGLLNDPKIRQALPKDFGDVEKLLKGTGQSDFSSLSAHFQTDNNYYQSDSNNFYAQELERSNKANAGSQSLGQAIYDAASKRIDGIETLKQRLGSATDAKEVMDLQARLSAESAFLQTDLLRMQGLKMVQDAQTQVANNRLSENRQKVIDGFKAAIQ